MYLIFQNICIRRILFLTKIKFRSKNLGQALKTETKTILSSFIDGFKKFYITKLKGFDHHQMCAATLLFEGNKEDVVSHENKIYSIAKLYNGWKANQFKLTSLEIEISYKTQ